MNLGDGTKAVADYSAAIQRDPKMGDAYVNRGYLEDAQGAYAVAIADDTQGFRLEPRWWQGYFNRGQSYLSLKEWQASVADLTVYIKSTSRASCACAYYERGNAYFNLSEYARAYVDHRQAIAIGPVETGYYEQLGADAYSLASMTKQSLRAQSLLTLVSLTAFPIQRANVAEQYPIAANNRVPAFDVCQQAKSGLDSVEVPLSNAGVTAQGDHNRLTGACLP